MNSARFTAVRDPLGFYSVTPMPSTEELAEFYRSIYFQATVSATYSADYTSEEAEFRTLNLSTLLDLAAEHGVKEGSFLDIGAGEGFLMAAARDRGFEVRGVDYSDYGVKRFNPPMAAAFEAEDIYAFLDRQAADTELFQLCAATNVLEHVIDPRMFLSKMKAVLHPSGVGLLTVPNDYSDLHGELLRAGYIDREFWFAPPQHLHYFTPASLAALCISVGLEVVDTIGSFPIDLLLFNESANYVADPSRGKAAHRMRMAAERLIAKRGSKAVLAYYRAMVAVGLGRDVTVVVRVSS